MPDECGERRGQRAIEEYQRASDLDLVHEGCETSLALDLRVDNTTNFKCMPSTAVSTSPPSPPLSCPAPLPLLPSVSLPPRPSSDLHDGLDGIDGHEDDTEEAGAHRGGQRLDGRGQVNVLESGHHAGVGSGVAETAQRALWRR